MVGGRDLGSWAFADRVQGVDGMACGQQYVVERLLQTSWWKGVTIESGSMVMNHNEWNDACLL